MPFLRLEDKAAALGHDYREVGMKTRLQNPDA
jgi:hypothetical protein